MLRKADIVPFSTSLKTFISKMEKNFPGRDEKKCAFNYLTHFNYVLSNGFQAFHGLDDGISRKTMEFHELFSIYFKKNNGILIILVIHFLATPFGSPPLVSGAVLFLIIQNQ